MADVIAMAAIERENLAELLTTLDDEQWATMTECDPWTVRHLAAHLTALGNQTAPNFFLGLIRNGFSFDKFVAKDLQRYNDGSNADVLGRFQATLAAPKAPPGPKYVSLGEFMCHGHDIRSALGVSYEPEPAHVAALADLYRTTGAPLRGKMRTKGLRFVADDVDFAAGEGPEVTGPGLQLILAMTGRRSALPHLSGDGVDTLADRCA